MDPASRPALAEEAGAEPLFAQRCKRVRHRQNDCRVCVEVCPEGAITLDPGPSVSERCTRCGLCQTACPTEALQGEVHSDQRLLGKLIESIVPLERRGNAGRPLHLHCREAEPQRADSVAVPCLGSVTENFLLGAIAMGAGSLTLVRGDCGRCRLRAGEALFAKATAAYMALAPAIGSSGSALKIEERQRRDQPSSARRMFFASFASPKDRRTERWPAPGTDASGPSGVPGTPSAAPTPGRLLLRALLQKASWSPTTSLDYDADLPWARVKIDQRDCATCGTCVNVCPTGAITRHVEKGLLSHHFSSALCVNCRLCEGTCPQHVISFEPDLDARDLVREEARAITSIPLHACEICGEVLPEREGRFCLTCQRRGRVESHVSGTVASL
jgi:ferredoxin